MKRDILAFHGFSGTGKSHVKNESVNILHDHTYFSTGDLARAIAKSSGIPEIGQYMEHARSNDIPIDALLDSSLRALPASNKKWIVDSRLAYYHLNKGLKNNEKVSFNVLLIADPLIIATRRLDQMQRQDGEVYKEYTVQQVAEMIKVRDANDLAMYRKLYPDTDCTDWNNYDLVIDTGKTSKLKTAGDVLRYYAAWQEDEYPKRLLIQGAEIEYL